MSPALRDLKTRQLATFRARPDQNEETLAAIARLESDLAGTPSDDAGELRRLLEEERAAHAQTRHALTVAKAAAKVVPAKRRTAKG